MKEASSETKRVDRDGGYARQPTSFVAFFCHRRLGTGKS